jgi:hypothetical protein
MQRKGFWQRACFSNRVDFDGHDQDGRGLFNGDAEAALATVLMSPAEALRRSQAAFYELLGELPQMAALACDPVPGAYWFPDITGWFSEAEALYLYTAIRLLQPRSILKIGTFYGRSTATICAAIKSMKSGARFVTIDLDMRSEEQVQATSGEIHGTDSMVMPAECNQAFNLGLSSTDYAKQQLRRQSWSSFGLETSGRCRASSTWFSLLLQGSLV